MFSITKEEYMLRTSRIQEKMAENDMDAVICYGDSGSYDNLRYLTTYWPIFEVGGVLIGRKGAPLVLIGGESPDFGAMTPFGMDSVRVCHDFGHACDDELFWTGVRYFSLRELFDEVTDGKGVRRLGIGDPSTIPHKLYKSVEHACLPGAEIIDFENVLIDLRMQRSQNELALIRKGCEISEKAFDTVLGIVTPEHTELEMEGLLNAQLYKDGAEGPGFPTACFSGRHSRCGIGRNTHNPLGRNTIVNVGLGCHYGGYASSYGRPFMFGRMPQKMKDQMKFLLDLHERLICDWVRPGLTTGEIYDKYCKEFQKNGYGIPPACASHGIGVFEGDLPSFSLNNPTVILPGMAVAGDHFFCLDDGEYGFRFEDCYAVTETGTDLFTRNHWECIEL